MKFRKKPIVIEATQWFKNGDHPEDYLNDFKDPVNDKTYTAEFRRAQNWEGDIVRYYRRPDDDGLRACEKCGEIMDVHGWVDTLEGGHIVCPGDWIVTGVQGEHYPCKPDIFALTYEAADASPVPIDLIIFCPICHTQHIDIPEPDICECEHPKSQHSLAMGCYGLFPEGSCLCLGFKVAWDNPSHKSHKCHGCGTIWRPSDAPTNGVAKIQTRGENDTWTVKGGTL